MLELMQRFLNAQLDLGLGKPILWREIVGNLFGLASALLGMRRKVSAWVIGIVGNILLFTVFLGGVFNTPQNKDLWGQAGRQVFFIITSVYGWVKWARFRRQHIDDADAGAGVEPRWATSRERIGMLVAGVVMWVSFFFILQALGSWGPKSDAWILAGSILATYGMARGWNEFWLIWIAVDAVGVPLLLKAQYYPSAIMYLFYGGFCAVGLWQWWRVSRRPSQPALSAG